MTEISIAGETFNVLFEGAENKAVLMLSHPLGTNLRIWDSQVPVLLQHFRVLRYDSRGHGASVADAGPYSVEGLGRDALAIMDALGVGKVHWLGLSMGSIVGQWLLAHAGERIGRAVLANTAARIPGPDVWNSRIQSARESGMHGIAVAAAERWFTKTFRDAHPEKVEAVMEMVRTTPLHGYVAGCAAIRDMDQRQTIRSVSAQVLVIAGRRDVSTPPEMGALVANSIAGAKFVTLEASHISNIEDEANFTKLALDFLTAPETAAISSPARSKAPARKAAAKKAPTHKVSAKKSARKKSARSQISAKEAPLKKGAAKTLKAQGLPKKAAAKKTALGMGSKKRAGKKAAPSKKTSARRKS